MKSEMPIMMPPNLGHFNVIAVLKGCFLRPSILSRARLYWLIVILFARLNSTQRLPKSLFDQFIVFNFVKVTTKIRSLQAAATFLASLEGNSFLKGSCLIGHLLLDVLDSYTCIATSES